VNHTKFLTISLPIFLIFSLLVFILPENMAARYVDIFQTVVLLAGAWLAFKVSTKYLKDLRMVFKFLSLYLLIFAIALIVLSILETQSGSFFIWLVLAMQFLVYIMLLISCIYIVKVVDVRRLNSTGWVIFTVTLVFCIFVAIFPPIRSGTELSLQYVLNIVIRLLDAALIVAMVPIIWLYLQYLKARQQQSLTFTVIVTGIIFSTVFDYLFQTIITAVPQCLESGSTLCTTIPEMIYSFGYSIITIGLYAHLKHDEWGFKAIEKALDF
jgi:hypothetical protein